LTQPARVRRAVDGVLLLDKPTGITSNAAIQQVKRLFAAAKAGHVGTLDPLASGLLPVCLGEATKFSTDAFSADKSYDAEVLLGVMTTTGDREGEVLAQKPVDVTRDQLVAVLAAFTGVLTQTPPMYSALKRDGKPLYAYARAGLTVERAPRSITIHGITLLDFAGDRFTIDVSCTKGTYIRVLAEDIGAALGCGATLAGLRRTQVGNFGLADAVSLAELEQLPEAQRTDRLLPVDSLADGLPALELEADAVTRILQGQGAQIDIRDDISGLVRLYGPGRRFLGLGELDTTGRLSPKRLVATSQSASSAAGAPSTTS
jgi:tRNA pseudouridine55 synthase